MEPLIGPTNYSGMVAPTPKNPGVIGPGLLSGLHEAGGILGAATQGVGQAVGSKALADWGQQVATSQAAAAQAAGNPELEEHPWSVSGLTYHALKGLPQIGAAVLGGLGGAAVGAAAGTAVEPGGGTAAGGIAGLAGAGAAMFPFMYGQNIEAAKKAMGGNLSDRDNAKAAALAVPEAALAGWMPKNLSKVIEDGAGGELAERVFKGAWTNAAVQAPAQAIQTAVTQQAFTPDMPIPDRAREIVSSALMGGAQGGIFGGVTHGIFKAKDPSTIGKNELDEKSAAELKRPAMNVSPESGELPPIGSPETVDGAITPENMASQPPPDVPRQMTLEELVQRPEEATGEALNALAGAPDHVLQAAHDTLAQHIDNAYSTSPENVEIHPRAHGLLQSIKDEITERASRAAQAADIAPRQLGYDPSPLVADKAGAVGRTVEEVELARLGRLDKEGQQVVPGRQEGEPTGTPEPLIQDPKLNAPPTSMEQGYVDPSILKLGNDQDVSRLLNPNGKVTDPNTGLERQDESRHWVATGEALNRIDDMKAQGTTEQGTPPRDTTGEHYTPGAPWHMTSGDTLTDLAQKLAAKKTVKVKTKSDDMAEGVLEATDRINNAKGTKGDQLVADHLGLLDKDGNTVPVEDALAKAHADLETAKGQHAMLPGHEEAKAGFNDAQARVDFLTKVKDATDRRDALHQAAEAAAQARFDHETSRATKLRAVEEPLKPVWDQLETAKADSPEHADTIQRLQTAIEEGQYNGPSVANGLRRAGAILGKVEAVKAAEAKWQNKVANEQSDWGNEGGRNLPAFAHVTPDMNVDQGVRQILSNPGSRGTHVLDYIANNHPDGEMRDLAGELQKRGVDANLKLDQTPPPARPGDIQFGEHVAGYDRGDGSVSVFRKAMTGAQTMLHELVHAGTAKAIDAGGRAAREMKGIYDKVLAHAGEEGSALYGLRDVHEFVSEAFTNPRFREFLKNARIDGPVGSMWRAFKNTVFKALGLHDRVRTPLDDVLEIGHQLMDEQLKLTDGRSVPADEAPRVGSVPDSNKMLMSFASDTADQLKIIATKILTQADRAARDGGWKGASLSEKWRGAMLGWRDADGMMDLYGHHFDGEMQKMYGAKKDFDNLRERLAQSAGPAARGWSQFKRDFPKSFPVLSRILNESQLIGADIRKDWNGQSDALKKREDAAVIAPMVDEHNRKWQTFVQNGGARAAESLFSAVRGDHYTRSVMLMHNLAEYGGYKQAGVHEDVHPGQQYLANSDLHPSTELTEQFWKGKFGEYLGRAEAYISHQDAEIARIPRKPDGSLTDQAQKMLDNTQAMREGIVSMKAASAQIESKPYLALGRSGDFFNAIQLVKTPDDGHAARDPATGRPLVSAVQRADELLRAEGITNVHISQAAGSNHIYIRSENADIAKTIDEKVFKVLQKEGYSENNAAPSKGNRITLNRELLREMAPGWVQKMADAMSARAEARGLSDADVASMKNEIHALWLDMVPDNSIHRVLEKREGVQGFNEDIGKSFAQRMETGINASAHLMTTPGVFDALGKMRKRTEDMKSDPNISIEQAIAAHQVVNELATREARRPWSVKHSWIDTLLQLNHSYFLGLSPGYATEVMSQVGTLLLPELAKKHGFKNAAQAIFDAGAPTMQVMKALMSSGHLLDATIIKSDLVKAGIEPKTVDFIMHLANTGAFELGGNARALKDNAIGVLDQSTKARALRFSNALAINAETMPRILAALAARALHEKDTSANKMPMHDYAHQVITNSMMNWSSWTTPRHLGKMGIAGPLGPVVTKFMSFQIKMLQRLHLETITAYGKHADEVAKMRNDLSGREKDALAAQMKDESKRFLGAHLAMIASLSGTMGLPFLGVAASVASSLGNFLTNGDSFDLETSYRKGLNHIFGETAGSAIAHGLPRLANTDLSELGEDRLLPFSDFMTDKRKWEDASQAMGWRALGSPASMIGNIIRGGRDIYMGNSLNGAREIMPPFLKNTVDMYRMTNYGYVDKNGVKLPVGENRSGEASVLDIMKAAVGLHSGELEDYDERARTLEGYRERRQFLSATIKVQLAKALESGNAEDIQKWVGKATSFGQAHPLNNPMLQIAPYMQQRMIQTGQARAVGTPIGTRIKDPGEMYYATP